MRLNIGPAFRPWRWSVRGVGQSVISSVSQSVSPSVRPSVHRNWQSFSQPVLWFRDFFFILRKFCQFSDTLFLILYKILCPLSNYPTNFISKVILKVNLLLHRFFSRGKIGPFSESIRFYRN